MRNKEDDTKQFETQCDNMKRQGYTEYSGIISVAKANVWAFITAGPFAVVAFILYVVRWQSGTIDVGPAGAALFLLLFLATIAIHEGIHGITWAVLNRNGFEKIRFGIIKKYLTPYCHCAEPMIFNTYLVGCLMPFFILGIGLYLIAFATQSGVLFTLSLLNILAAGGDLTIALMLLKYKDAEILDHPTQCGFVAFRKEEDQ